MKPVFLVDKRDAIKIKEPKIYPNGRVCSWILACLAHMLTVTGRGNDNLALVKPGQGCYVLLQYNWHSLN